jgi:uncharacterized protein (DUF302 family)
MIATEYNVGQKNVAVGLTTLRSHFGLKETMERLEADIKALGMTVFARINHAALAAEVGLRLQPTELLIFGAPLAGSPLMQANQTIGIDLPLKVLVWEDAEGATWLTYNEPEWLAQRHGLDVKTKRFIETMALTLRAIAKQVTDVGNA